jgi:hypothetical protein
VFFEELSASYQYGGLNSESGAFRSPLEVGVLLWKHLSREYHLNGAHGRFTRLFSSHNAEEMKDYLEHGVFEKLKFPIPGRMTKYDCKQAT